MTNRARRGYIFIEALIVVAGLVALMAMLAADQKASVDSIQYTMDQRRAKQAADSAVARSMALLQQANPDIVTLQDDWAQFGDYGDKEYDFDSPDENMSYRVQLLDASSLINLNTASQTQLQELPLDQDQVDSLLDWRETGTQPRSDGAKDSFYNSLPQPYNTKLGPLTTVNELLLVQYWTAQMLYGPPLDQPQQADWPTDENGNEAAIAGLLTVDSGAPNTQADGSARVNISQIATLGLSPQVTQAIERARHKPDSFEDLVSTIPGISPNDMQKILDTVTFTTGTRLQGMINLNTASQAVLETLPGMSTDVASSIASSQSQGLQTLGQLATLSGVSVPQLAQFVDDVSIGSDTWIVRAYGKCGNSTYAEEDVVRLTNSQVQIISQTRLNTIGIPTWWNWDTQPDETGDVEDPQ